MDYCPGCQNRREDFWSLKCQFFGKNLLHHINLCGLWKYHAHFAKPTATESHGEGLRNPIEAIINFSDFQTHSRMLLKIQPRVVRSENDSRKHDRHSASLFLEVKYLLDFMIHNFLYTNLRSDLSRTQIWEAALDLTLSTGEIELNTPLNNAWIQACWGGVICISTVGNLFMWDFHWCSATKK